ncbi:glycosyltransferase family 4 protein [Agrobacterium sp. NPDC090273]|uniref:glycosyltransferase family 4 protein n=1 Tax=Agrobacterium sp. NPDC090273 TaxID=3363919 RepID=UPI00383AF5BC
MRIALCSALYPTPKEPWVFGGAEMFLRQFAEGLAATGDDVIVIRIALDGTARQEIANGVTVHFLPIRNLFPPFEANKNPLARMAWHLIDDRGQASSLVRDVLKEFKPDVFHTHTLNGHNADVWNVARALGIPIVHTLHDYYLICPKCTRFNAIEPCEHACVACSLLTKKRRQRTRLIDAVTSVSRRTLDIHQSEGLFDSTSSHVIHHVANPAIRFEQPVPYEGVLKVGYIGRFAEEKGVQRLIQAVGELPSEQLALKLAGSITAEDEARLRQLAPSANLQFLGFVDPVEFYHDVHVCVAPSIWEEPAGLVILDALAAGRPVIGSFRGGISEGIENGVTGWIVQPTVEAIRDILAQLLSEPVLLSNANEVLASRANTCRSFADLLISYRSVYKTLMTTL